MLFKAALWSENEEKAHFLFLFLLSLLKKIYFLIWLHQAFIAAGGIFDILCSMWTLSCSMRDLISQPGIKPKPLALGAQSFSYWATREVLSFSFSSCSSISQESILASMATQQVPIVNLSPRAHSTHPRLGVWAAVNTLGFWIQQWVFGSNNGF